MNKKLFRHVLSFLASLFLLLHLVGCAISPAPISDKSGDYEFAELLEKIRQKEKLPAIAASVIIDGNIYVKGAVGTRKYGTNNWVTLEDKFLIGSCGKAVTAALAAVLINEGLLEWNTSLGQVFPEIKMHPKWESITIQHLLTNRSGYADDPKGKLLPNDILLPIWNDNNPPKDMRLRYMKSAINIKPIHEPNKVVIYANSGFLVAGVMLETVSKKSFENLMQEKLFNPLALSTAGYGSPATIDPISQPYGHYSNSPIQKDFPDYISPRYQNCILKILA
jgi:CubicO group peptidase (beta-lactamase class C family)